MWNELHFRLSPHPDKKQFHFNFRLFYFCLGQEENLGEKVNVDFVRAKFYNNCFCTINITFYFNWPSFLLVEIIDTTFRSAGTGKYVNVPLQQGI